MTQVQPWLPYQHKTKDLAYLSSGTWSLMGIEVKDAIINKESL